MKRLLPLLALLLVAGLATWYYRRSDSENQIGKVDAEAAARQSSGRPAATRSSHLPAHRPNRPQVSQVPGTEPGSPEEAAALISQDMAKRQEMSRETKVEGYATALKESLHLTDEQAAAIRAILDEDGSVEGGIQPGSLPENADVAALDKATTAAAEADTRIAALLDPTQQQDYAALRNEQREQRTDVSLARDMSQLQRTTKLSPDQESRIREAFNNLAWTEEEKPPGFHLDVAKLRAKKQARLEVLRTILTDEQLKAYEGKGAQ